MTTTDPLTFTPDYFRAELLRFREAFGNRAIMADYAKREEARKGFTFVYLGVRCAENELQGIADLFLSTCTEFDRRCHLFDTYRAAR